MTVPSSSPAIVPSPSPHAALYDAAQTARLLPYADLVEELARAAIDRAEGRITSPERMVVPLGEGGVMLSMPATARDIGVHKLVNVQPANARLQLPTIHGTVTVCDATTGRPLCLLDAPEVTGRRTAAISMLAMRTLRAGAPQDVLLIGTGTQARFHLQALQSLYPEARIWVRGHHSASSHAFCEAVGSARVAPCPDHIPEAVDTVITLTTSTTPVYDEAPRRNRLVIGVGAFKPEMAELGATTLATSALYADDPHGARHEAGDLLRAGVDWSGVRSLAEALQGRIDPDKPHVFKSVGAAAWDLAAARLALRTLAAGTGQPTA